MNTKDSIIEFRNVWRSYRSGDSELHILKDVSLTIQRGESVAFVGPSGSGKSTLLNLAGLVDRPSRGIVRFDELSVESSTAEKELAALRRNAVGFIFQHFHLINSLTVLHNAALPALLNRLSDPFDRARDLLIRVGLGSRMNHYPEQLSGGEMQRCGIARALVHRPRVIIADEPTGSLDPRTAAGVLEVLWEVSADVNGAILFATHSHEAASKASRIIEFEALSTKTSEMSN